MMALGRWGCGWTSLQTSYGMELVAVEDARQDIMTKHHLLRSSYLAWSGITIWKYSNPKGIGSQI